MHGVQISTLVYIFTLMGTILCGRNPKPRKTLTYGRLSKYLSRQDRLRLQWVPIITDDEDLFQYRPSNEDKEMQGDIPPNNVKSEDIQKEMCCTLGKATSTENSRCSARPYIRLLKRNIRQRHVSQKSGLKFSSDINDTEANTYKCVLKHKSTFEKCCLASKTNSFHYKRLGYQQKSERRRKHQSRIGRN